MNKEEIDKILSRLERIDHKEYNCSFEFADSGSFEETCLCFDERKKLANYIKELQQELNQKNKIIEALKNNLKYKVDSWEKQVEEWAKSGFCEFGYQSTTAIVCKDLLREIEELEKGSEDSEI